MKKTEEEKDERAFKHEAGKRSFNEIINDLYKNVPARFIHQRKQGNALIDYISWYDAVKLMDYYAPGWKYEVRLEQYGEQFYVIARVTLVCSDGEFSREAIGCEDLEGVKYGDTSSNAESMALRRAFAKFGLALHLYQKDAPEQSGSYRQPQSANKPVSSGGGGANKPTEKQLNYLAKLTSDAALAEIDVAQEYSDGRCELFSEMTFDEVSAAITALK
jgi:hypothetical protein